VPKRTPPPHKQRMQTTHLTKHYTTTNWEMKQKKQPRTTPSSPTLCHAKNCGSLQVWAAPRTPPPWEITKPHTRSLIHEQLPNPSPEINYRKQGNGIMNLGGLWRRTESGSGLWISDEQDAVELGHGCRRIGLWFCLSPHRRASQRIENREGTMAPAGRREFRHFFFFQILLII